MKASLDAAGARAVLALNGLPDKGDVSDWLDAGGTAERLLELVAEEPGKAGDLCKASAADASPLVLDDIDLVRDQRGRPVWN